MNKRIQTNILALCISVFAAGMFTSCSGRQKEERPVNRKALEESLIEANRNLVRQESEEIDAFLKKHAWRMTKSGSGLRYMIYEQGTGRTAKEGDRLKFEYTMRLLGGDTVESSESGKYLEFSPGKENVISGLHEIALLMREGDSAKVIIPSYLAYGLTGLPNKVPPRASLIYDMKLLEIN